VDDKSAAVRTRLVVSGVNAGGQSYVVSDGPAREGSLMPAVKLEELWTLAQVPGPVLADSAPDDGAYTSMPPAGGIRFLVGTFPPDKSWNDDPGASDETVAAYRGMNKPDAAKAPGYHQSDTVDLIYVLSGELISILDEEEVVLKAGDAMVQRGTPHAWSNRTDEPAVALVALIDATR
jgi:mannose-6-phosphate isomerase-like protein (cupin superfamily)